MDRSALSRYVIEVSDFLEGFVKITFLCWWVRGKRMDNLYNAYAITSLLEKV